MNTPSKKSIMQRPANGFLRDQLLLQHLSVDQKTTNRNLLVTPGDNIKLVIAIGLNLKNINLDKVASKRDCRTTSQKDNSYVVTKYKGNTNG